MANIRQLKNGNYKITVSNGRDINGKQIREYTLWEPEPEKTKRQNEKALELFALEFEKKVKKGAYLDGEKLKYADFITLWKRDYCETQMQVTTRERTYYELDARILPAIGHLKMAQIKPLHIQQIYNNMQENGYERNGTHYDYSTNSIKRTHQVLSSSFNTAVQWQLIDSNPCNRVKPPKAEKQVDVKHFTLEQAQTFLDYLTQPYAVTYRGHKKKDGSSSAERTEIHSVPLQFQLFFKMALFGGFRRGELTALTWNDIDFDKNSVNITKSTARTKDGMINKTPKNFSSNRTVNMPADVMQLLKRHKVEQSKYRLAVGSYWKGSDFIFTQDDGKQMDISTPNGLMRKIIRRYNASVSNEADKLPLINVHGLRHTSATLLIAQNIDVKTVSNRLGHSETSTTMDIYAHALEKQDAIAAESLSNMFQKNA